MAGISQNTDSVEEQLVISQERALDIHKTIRQVAENRPIGISEKSLVSAYRSSNGT